MPLETQELADAHVTAARLVRLLPVLSGPLGQSAGKTVENSKVPQWMQLTALSCALALGLVMSIVLTPKPISAVTAPIAQTVEHTP